MEARETFGNATASTPGNPGHHGHGAPVPRQRTIPGSEAARHAVVPASPAAQPVQPALPKTQPKKRGPRPGTRPTSTVMAKAPAVTLKQMVRAYLDDLQVRNYKPKTINGYAKNLSMFVNWAATQGATTLGNLDADLAKRYIRYLQEKPKYAERGYASMSTQRVSASAIRNYVRDLKTFAAWLAEEHYTPVHVLATVKTPKADETPIEPFSDEELDRIFGSLDTTEMIDLRDYVLLHTLWDTGLREGELVNLALDDLDLARQTLRITHAKFGKWRDIGFGKETHKYLTRYLSLCRPEAAVDGDRHLFLSFDGYPLQEMTVQKICQRLTKRIGIHIHAHRFRHTFAVNMLRAGTDLRTLQRLMGHSDIRILARYLNLASDEAIRAHQSNSPADRFRQQQLQYQRRQLNGNGRGQRLPARRALISSEWQSM